jgi:uncharacterized protein (DUF1778 family)
MSTKKKQLPSPIKNYRIRFRDAGQLSLIKRAAKQQGLSFNMFVTHVCETAAQSILKHKPMSSLDVLTNAVNESLTER